MNFVDICSSVATANIGDGIMFPLSGPGGELLRSCLTGTEELGIISQITSTATILALDNTQIAVAGILNETKQGNSKTVVQFATVGVGYYT